MDRELKKITQVMDALDSLYEVHLKSFDQEVLPDLEGHTRERGPAVEALQTAVNEFIETAPANENTREKLEFIKNRVSGLIQLNQSLAGRVRDHKAVLKTSLKNVSAGKRAMRAYGSLAPGSPKILSRTE